MNGLKFKYTFFNLQDFIQESLSLKLVEYYVNINLKEVKEEIHKYDKNYWTEG